MREKCAWESEMETRSRCLNYSHVGVFHCFSAPRLQVPLVGSTSLFTSSDICTEPTTMLSTRPIALEDGPATYAYTRTPAEGLLKSRGALQENTTTVLRGPKTLNTGKGKAVALCTPTQNRQSGKSWCGWSLIYSQSFEADSCTVSPRRICIRSTKEYIMTC